MSTARCPNCDAALSGQDLAAGWCDACGKKLPPGKAVLPSGAAGPEEGESLLRFPCECGRELSAEPSQAGLTVSCPCGRAVRVPAWRRALGESRPIPQEAGRSRLTALGWMFLLLAAGSVVSAGLVPEVLDPGPGRRLLRVMLGAVALLLVGAAAAVVRVLGGRFFRS